MERPKHSDRKEPEIVYSKAVKAGKRIYYLDVKKARNEDLYVCITESKKTSVGEEAPQFEKHKIFLYKEDFTRFMEDLNDVIGYVKQELGEIANRPEWAPAEAEAPQESSLDEAPQNEEPKANKEVPTEEKESLKQRLEKTLEEKISQFRFGKKE